MAIYTGSGPLTDFLIALLYAVPLVSIWTYIVIHLFNRLSKCHARMFPDGPTGLPFLGYLPYLGAKPHVTLAQLTKTYGPIIGLRLGRDPVVVLNDYQSVKEAFNKSSLNERPPHDVLSSVKYPPSFTEVNGATWQAYRKCLLAAINSDLDTLEDVSLQAIKKTLSNIHENCPINSYDLVTTFVSSVTLNHIIGSEPGEEKLKSLNEAIDRIRDSLAVTSLHQFYPWLSRVLIIPGFTTLVGLKDTLHIGLDFAREAVARFKHDQNNNNLRGKSLISLWYSEMNNCEDGKLDEDALVGCVTSSIGAGIETTRTSLIWILLIVASKVDVQRKLQAEIETIIGNMRGPKHSDMVSMPYTRAVIWEVLRWKSPVPLNLMRCSSEDFTIGSFIIPKDTKVIANLWAINHDEYYWGDDVENFIPERHLHCDQDDQTTNMVKFIKGESLLPFSYGGRCCPGKRMAILNMFLFLTNILQKYDISTREEISLDDNFSITLQPLKKFNLWFKERKL